jgi:glycosyltransferase involved in cell wall biosynthesis
VRIAIFGNTNNFPFSLARGLQQLGIETALVVNRTERLHRPESVDPSFERGYPSWILDASGFGEQAFIDDSPALEPVVKFLREGSAAVLLNDIGPSLFRRIRLPAVCLLTGSDLTSYADYQMVETRRGNGDPEYYRLPEGRRHLRHLANLVTRQRDGILGSEAVAFAHKGVVPRGDELLRSIGVTDRRRFFCWNADTIRLAVAPPPQNDLLRIWAPTRVNWRLPMPDGFTSQDHKGTDVLLRGFAAFIAAGGRAQLRLVAKGLHVQDGQELARALGLEPHVVWLPEMTHAAVHDEMRQADIVADQFGQSLPGLVMCDALAIGRPVVANFRPDLLAGAFAEPVPGAHADTPETVCAELLRLAKSPEVRTDLARRGRAFAERYLSPQANALQCLRRLGLVAAARS